MTSSNRFKRDVSWNLGSVVVLGVCGICLNVIIGRYYGPEVFGVFSLVLAVYYVLSQLAVGGFVYSALNFVADHARDKEATGAIVVSGVVVTGVLAGSICGAAFLAADSIGRFFESPDVARGILWALPGLWFFAINKVLLSSLNGLRHMRFYALCNALRFIFILAVLSLLAGLGIDGSALPVCISLGEVALLPILIAYLFANGLLNVRAPLGEWISRHLHFGLRSFFSGLLLDLNIKVDVIVLGYFLNDREVGIYSFAAMLAVEGAYQIAYAVQVNVSPILSRLKVEDRMNEAKVFVRKSILLLCPAMAAVTIVGSILFPYFAEMLTGRDSFSEGWTYFAILLTGITISSSYIPIGTILNQWGYPGWFTIFASLQVLTNVLLNFWFVPLWGAPGAAVATALAFVANVFYLKILVARVTGVSI